MPNKISKEDVREVFLDHLRHLVDYWDKEHQTPITRDKLSGMAFSILSFIDGCCDLPQIDLVYNPDPEYKQDCIDEGLDYIERGTVINDDCMLHELFYKTYGKFQS
ncbi:MAG: hypothetical protein GY804_02885 [Alphaproteobacteria bacterium]|nr:hypothetical protein [Alphaproteobacteria bacterium]